MRKKFFIVVLIPLTVIAIIVYLFIDSWAESAIEYAAENVVGAKVEINNLHVHLFPLGMDWAKMEVADPQNPWKNLFQTGNVNFAMDPGQLIRGKVLIETVEVQNLLVGTKRKTDGSLPESRRKGSVLSSAKNTFSKMADDALKQMVGTTPIFDVTKLKSGFNPDSLLKAFNFKTIGHIDTLKAEAEKTFNEWNLVKSDFETSKARLIDIQNKIKAINTSELNNVQNITSAIATVDNAVKTVNDVQQTFTNRSRSITTNINSLASSVDSIDDFAKEDFQRLKNMARLPSINTPTIASLLAGNEMYNRVKTYLYWIDFARANVKKYQPEPDYTKPPRMKGQNISFPIEHSYPKFWIKKILITGGTDGSDGGNVIKAKGEADNITSNQSLTGVPLTISLAGTSNNRVIKINGLFDRRGNTPLDEYSASLSGVPLGQFQLGKSDFLPTKITDAYVTSSVKISAPGNRFDSNFDFKFTNAHLQFEAEPRNIGERIVREVLSGINNFDINLRLWNTKGNFDVALSTDLDEQLSQRLTDVLGAEFVRLQNELKSKFDAFISQQKDQFEKQYNSKIEDIKKQLDGYTSLVNDNLGTIDSKKKELLDKLDKQKNSFLENKLKNIFKK